MKTGGQQTLIVQHVNNVNIEQGGQAVVAGRVEGGISPRRDAPSCALAAATPRCHGMGRRAPIEGRRRCQRGNRLRASSRLGLPPGPLESRSPFAEVLIPPDRRKGITLQYVARVPVATEPIVGLAERLDRVLMDLFSDTTRQSS
jgi:hypothetical protein